MPRKKRSENNIDTVDSFYSDVIKEGMFYATIVHCPSPGTISSFDIPDMPDGYFFFSAKDIPGKNYITTNGINIPIFADKTVSYKGEPFGIVVGKDKNQISKIIKQIEIPLDEKSMLDALDNIYPNSENINEQNTSNSSKVVAERIIKIGTIINDFPDEVETNDNSDSDISDNKKNQKISLKSSMSPFVPNWLETNGACCLVKNGEYTIYTGTKYPEKLKTDLASVLGITEENIAIKKTKISDCTDGLWRTTTFAAIAAVAASKLEKPVMLSLDRSEENHFIAQYPKTEIAHEAHIEENGKIVSLKTDIKVDVGAFNPYSQIIVDRLAIATCNVYQFDNMQISVTAITSENPPTSLPSQMVEAPAFFAIENLMNKIALEMYKIALEENKIALEETIFPRDVKEINCQNNESMFLREPQRIKSVYDALVPDRSFNRKYVTFNNSNKLDRSKIFKSIPIRGVQVVEAQQLERIFKSIPLRGIGIACAFNGSDYADDFLSNKTQQVEISLDAEENIIVNSFLPLNEIKSSWNSIIEKELGIPKNKVKYEKSDDFGSMGILTELFEKCVSDMKRRRNTEKEFPIICRRKKQPISKTQWNSKTFTGNPFSETSFGGAIVELQSDKCTNEITIKNISIAVECGKIISEAAAIRSIKIAIAKELSNLVKGKTFLCENISITTIKSDFYPSAIADIVHNTLPAAFVSALSQVLGKDIFNLPFDMK